MKTGNWLCETKLKMAPGEKIESVLSHATPRWPGHSRSEFLTIFSYYIKTSEIPGFFLLLKNHAQWGYYFYLSRVRILVSPWLLKKIPLLWLQNPLKRTWMCHCMSEKSSVLPRKSSEIFSNLRKFSDNFRKGLSGLRLKHVKQK